MGNMKSLCYVCPCVSKPKSKVSYDKTFTINKLCSYNALVRLIWAIIDFLTSVNVWDKINTTFQTIPMTKHFSVFPSGTSREPASVSCQSWQSWLWVVWNSVCLPILLDLSNYCALFHWSRSQMSHQQGQSLTLVILQFHASRRHY